MYQDHSLMPSETARLLALGILADGEVRYADLAEQVRGFIERIVGPSLDIVASPLELLKVEGFIEPVGDSAPPRRSEAAMLRITDAGRQELIRLLTARARPPVNELNRLIIALKMRFLHLLEPAARREQLDILIEMSQSELGRLLELRERHGQTPGHLSAWLDQEIAQSRARMGWFDTLRNALPET